MSINLDAMSFMSLTSLDSSAGMELNGLVEVLMKLCRLDIAKSHLVTKHSNDMEDDQLDSPLMNRLCSFMTTGVWILGT